MSRTRVLWVTKGLGRGGAEQLLLSAARSIDHSQFEVEVAYQLPHKDALVDDLAGAGVRVHCLGGGRIGWVVRLRRLVRQRRYDVVHTHMPLPAVAARLALGPGRPRLVHTEHNMWNRYRMPTYVANLVTYAVNDHVLAVSGAVAQSIERRRVPRVRPLPPIEVLVHGIDLAAASTSTPAEVRERLGLPANALVVGTVGNLTPKKDHRTLLDAFARLRPHQTGGHLLVVGSGPLEAALRAQVAALGLSGRVHFLGMRDDVPDLLTAMDVFVLSSLFEGLSIALVEALAAGLPCVITDVGGMPEVVAHRVEGLVVPPADARSLAAALRELLESPGTRLAMAEAARRRATAFDIAPSTRRIEQIYREVLVG